MLRQFWILCLLAATLTVALAEEETLLEGAKNLTRVKRQWGCPSNCFSSCNNNQQCQSIKINSVCQQNCCCTVDIDTACSGDPAVAACLNGLCGQGYFCSRNNFCCRCQAGSSSGPCVNGFCPAGYACNTNDYCCPIGSSSVIGVCVNGECPQGYECGQGSLCYQSNGDGTITGK